MEEMTYLVEGRGELLAWNFFKVQIHILIRQISAHKYGVDLPRYRVRILRESPLFLGRPEMGHKATQRLS